MSDSVDQYEKACERGDLQKVIELLKLPEVMMFASNGFSLACNCEQIEIIKYLLNYPEIYKPQIDMEYLYAKLGDNHKIKNLLKSYIDDDLELDATDNSDNADNTDNSNDSYKYYNDNAEYYEYYFENESYADDDDNDNFNSIYATDYDE